MLILLCFLPCVFDKECLLFCLQTCLLLFLRFQPCLFNKEGEDLGLKAEEARLKYEAEEQANLKAKEEDQIAGKQG